MKVLIVDDSRTMRRIVARKLREAGYDDAEVLEAANGQDALELVRENGPDLILCDWNMPVMSGIEFLKKVRELGRRVPFGFITAERTTDMKAEATEAGAQFFITKPFTAEEMRKTLAPVLAAT